MDLSFETKKIDDLIPAGYNPRLNLAPGDPDYEKLKRSIETFGLVEPIVFNQRSGRVVGGHQRLKILKEKGMKTTTVSVVDLDDDQETALNLALNKIEGEWDTLKLKEILESLDPVHFDMTGFSEAELADMIESYEQENEPDVTEDDFDPDAAADEIEAESEPGDVWRLGRHRLMVGDATSETDLLTLMNGESADMVFTDPPYNVDYEGGSGKKIKNDKQEDQQFYTFLFDAFRNMHGVMKKGAAIYVCHADSEGRNFRNAFADAGFLMKQCLIWVKSSLVMGRQDYHWKHEPILYGWKDGAAHTWRGGRKQTTVDELPVDLAISREKDHAVLTFTNGTHSTVVKVPSYEILHAGADDGTTTWRIEKPKRSVEHPTMKPIQLCARAIQNSAKQEGRVLDPFGGSGSTLIAAEQTGRICHMMEFDPIYADVIVKRWEDFTNQKAVKME